MYTWKEAKKRADSFGDMFDIEIYSVKALKKATKSKPSVKISTKLVEGRPSDTIIETAKAGDFDIIVMGSRGLGGIKEFLLGSVSHRVAEEAPCPVLIVK